jgi:hypothetical protein
MPIFNRALSTDHDALLPQAVLANRGLTTAANLDFTQNLTSTLIYRVIARASCCPLFKA